MAYLVQTKFLSHGYEVFNVFLARSPVAKSSILHGGMVKGSPRINRTRRMSVLEKILSDSHNTQVAQKRGKLLNKRGIACDHPF